VSAKLQNVTVTVSEEAARWARVRAAERNISLSRFLGELLDERMRADDAYAAAMERFLGRKRVALGGGPYPRREELYDRPVLRRH
jgi:hypothetical protein